VSGVYYAFLDAYRSWQGGGTKGQLTSEDGIADGVMLHSSIPILGVQIDHALANNLNGMCQAVVMAKASGAEDWETIRSITTAGNSTDTTYLTLPTPDPYSFLFRGILPADGEGVIRTDRARDAGSTTSDGSTRTIATNGAGPWYLRKDANTAAAHVQDSGGVDVLVPNTTTVELAGGNSGSWREVIYNDGANEYRGWLPLSFLNTGSTAGGDTLIDGGKNWVAGELIGAQVKIVGSPNKNLVGKVHTVASNTSTTITVTSGYGATVPQGTTYETIQPKTTVSLQDRSLCWVDFDASSISLSAVSAKENVYQIAAEISVGDGGPALFERKVATRIGLDGRKVFARTTDKLILDGPNRKASLVDSTGALIRTLTDPSVLVQQVSQDPVNRRKVTKRSARWSPLGMGINLIPNGNAETGVVGFYIPTTGAGWAIDPISIDGVTPMTGTKSYLANVTASGLANTFSVIGALASFKVGPGQRLQFVAGLRTSNINLRAVLGVRWLDALGNEVSANYAPAWTPVAATWYRCGYSIICGARI
jgi:RNase P/RNase MRP subunit p29